MNKRFSIKIWDITGATVLNLLILVIVFLYLLPIAYMLTTSVKDGNQFSDPNAPIWPARNSAGEYEGESYPIYTVPFPEGDRELMLVTPRRQQSQFIDPDNPAVGLIEWEGNWRQLEPVYEPYVTFEAFSNWLESLNYLQIGRNTLIVVGLTEIGVLITSILVAYGFSRFPVPYGDTLFLILIGTIILPEKVTLVPTYFTFVRVFDWQGTWWPLVVPFWFGSAVLIFLLRQNFKLIPKELEESAMLDGAGPLRILFSVIIPMSWPTIVTVGLLHFFYIWNETRLASLYLLSAPDKHTLVSGLLARGTVSGANNLQARALITMIIPAAVLFLSQRYFMRGVQVTGLDKG